jgi:eukaryotic-like serine/threonine-protein kinase
MVDRFRKTDALIPEDRLDTRPSPKHRDESGYDDFDDDFDDDIDECMLTRGDRIEDKYEIVLLLGKGGMGEVYLARDVLLDRHVAIKVLQASLLGRFERTAAKRFLREARIISSLKHPNTVTVFSYGTLPAGNAYIVMEYVEGEALDERLDKVEAIPLDGVAAVFSQICLALKEAHQMGVVHRDLKPANILLTDIGDTKDFVKVLDFGLAKRFKDEPDVEDATVTASEAILGSPAYMSPEQASGLPLDPRSDIYSLGIVLYEMITGKLPLVGRTPLEFLNAQITKKPLPPSQRRPDLAIPAPLDTIVMRMLEKDPEHRYSSVDTVMTAGR